MKKLLAISFLVLCLQLAIQPVQSRTVTVVKNVDNGTYQNNAYNRDLNVVEKYLFGTTYFKESTSSRLNRIEHRLFNRTYSSMNNANRMNNIMANYRQDYNYNRNYLSNYYDNSTPVSRIRNRFIGQPTGYTPQIYNTPFGSNFYSPGFSSSNITNRGYSYNNGIPMTTGAGIQILH